MSPARVRRAFIGASLVLAFAAAFCVRAASAPVPAVPRVPASRPAAAKVAALTPAKPGRLAVTRLKNIDCVSLTEVATNLGYKSSWDAAKREFTLTRGEKKVVFTTDRREVICEGIRLFLGDAVQAHDGKIYLGKTDYEGCLLAILRPDLAGPLPSPVKTIAIDPGHGGNDPGMENETLHLQEKVLTLDVALRLEKLLQAAGYKVVLTRRDDRHLGPTKSADWQQRGIIANQAGADLFVSVHFNSLYPNTRVGGTETFVFTRAGQRSDQSLGSGQGDDHENESAPINRFDGWSSLFARSMQEAVLKKLGTSDRGMKTKHSAPLRGLNCPGILVESVFLSNEHEAQRAAIPAYRQEIAEAIAEGVRSYVTTLDALRPKPSPTPGTSIASPTSVSR